MCLKAEDGMGNSEDIFNIKVCDLDPKVMVIGTDVADKNLKQYLSPYQIHLKAPK